MFGPRGRQVCWHCAWQPARQPASPASTGTGTHTCTLPPTHLELAKARVGAHTHGAVHTRHGDAVTRLGKVNQVLQTGRWGRAKGEARAGMVWCWEQAGSSACTTHAMEASQLHQGTGRPVALLLNRPNTRILPPGAQTWRRCVASLPLGFRWGSPASSSAACPGSRSGCRPSAWRTWPGRRGLGTWRARSPCRGRSTTPPRCRTGCRRTAPGCRGQWPGGRAGRGQAGRQAGCRHSFQATSALSHPANALAPTSTLTQPIQTTLHHKPNSTPHLWSGMTPEVRVTMPLTEMSLLMSAGLRSRITLVSRRL